MTSWGSNDLGHSARSKASEYRRGRKSSNWSGINIAAMVLGFVFFWPVGLLILFWILTGRNAVDLPSAIKAKWVALRSGADMDLNFSFESASDNVVFNEYQQTQHDKIREIKHEIAERSKRFNNWRADAQRRVDEAEFEAFMKDGY